MSNPTRPQLNAEKSLGGYTQRHARKLYIGELGNNSGVVDDTARTTSGQDFVFVRLNQDANQVVSALAAASFPHIADVIVVLELVERKGAPFYQVLGIAPNIVYSTASATWSGVPGEHANQHERRDRGAGGFDPLDVYTRALVNLRARAQVTPDLTVHVERGFYIFSSVKEYAGGNSAAFVPPATASSQRWDLLYLGSDDALHITTGVAVSGFGTPVYPTCPVNAIPLAYVILRTAQTSILEADITDARVLWTANGLTPAAHNILSTAHGDTTVAVPSDNDVLTWDTASGKWRAEALPTLGAGWTRTLDNTPGSHVMAFANCGNGLIIVGGDDSTPSGTGHAIVRRSFDGGQTWGAAINVDVTISYLVLSLCYIGNGIVLAGTDCAGKLYRSTNYGASWTYITALDTDGVYSVVKLSDGSILAGTNPNGKIYRSVDNGLTWNLQYTAWSGAGSQAIYNLVDCGGGVIIAGGGAGSATSGYIYKSTNYGVTWTQKAMLDTFAVLSVAYDGSKLYAGTTTIAKIYLSADLGETWDGGTVLDTFPIWSLRVLDAGGVIAGTMNNWNTGAVNGGNVYRTSDHGASWNLWKALPGYVTGLIDAGGGHPLAGVSGWYTSPSSVWAYLGGDAQVPRGTGFRHVTLGAEDPAAKLVANADVDASAAIAESKLALNYATHAQVHAIDGANHSAAGLTVGDVLTATGAASFAFQAPSGDGGGGHLHGLDRWVADGAASAFDLLDIAEYVDSVTDNGSDVDALTYSLSADGTQVVFDSIPTNTHILQCNYVIMGG